jgi:adenylate cyclase
MPIEMERKFILPQGFMNDRPYIMAQKINQGYLSESLGSVVRVRLCTTTYMDSAQRSVSSSKFGYLTIKLSRVEGSIGVPEYEYEIPFSDAEDLINSCRYTISKDRYYLNLGEAGHLLEVDVFSGRHSGLIVGEVEFKSEEDYLNFKPPVFSKLEVTEDKRFSNFYLARALQENVDSVITEMYITKEEM